MNETHEPSYYEIALTNRQVLVAFVVLLLAVLGAFVGGVWLGRSGAQTPEPAAVVADDALPGDVEALDELTFFSDRDPGAAPPPEAPPPPPPPPRAPAPRPSAAPPPSEDATLADDLGIDVPPPPPTPPPPPPVRPATASLSGPGFVIQVFSGRDESQARGILERLTKDGKKAFLSPVAVGSLTMYRVRVGPYTDRAAADREADEITREHKLDTWITAVDS